MHTENSALIHADPRSVYELAAEVARWPELLPHYRWVRVLAEDGDLRLVEMAARRGAIPVWWCAEQRLYPAALRIIFRHVRGLTSGMDVEWTFVPVGDDVLVTIRHDLRLGLPVLGGIIAERIIGPYFVHHIAGKTLHRIKQVAEAPASRSQPFGAST
jgi:ribosome-associated toxin RatA of RatAB toxin-antitoxin module